MGKVISLIIAIGVLTFAAHVWGKADAVRDRAQQEYIACRISAHSPEASSQCEAHWKKAQDAYNIP